MRKVVQIVLILLLLPTFGVRASDFRFQADASGDNSTVIEQWYLDKINAKEAWSIAPAKKKVVVAVLDTGIDMDHPDIQRNIWVNMDELDGDKIDNDGNGYIDDINGWDFLNSVANPSPKFGLGYTADAVKHGTFVAGIIAALHDGKYIDGVATDIRIMPLRVLDSYGYGDSYPVAEAINYAVDNGADVVNLSFGGVVHSQALKSAVLRAYDAGVVIVAAAGNNEGGGGTDIGETNVYPICYDKEFKNNMIIGVSAVDEKDAKTTFSNFGSDCVDISAPGINISSLSYQDDSNEDFKNYTIANWRGTSFATALVSGAAAFVKASHPEWNNVKIIDALLSASKNIDDLNVAYVGKMGKGRLDMQKVAEIASAADVDSIKLFIANAVGGGSVVSSFGNDGKSIDEFEIFGGSGVNGLNVDIADVDDDGVVDIVVGGVTGEFPWVRATKLTGQLISGFVAYPENFTGGVNVAVGDVDKDGEKEIIVVPAGGGSRSEVKIFSLHGELKKVFAVAGLKNIGLVVDSGDVNGDGRDEIIVGTGSGVSPEVKIFDGTGKLLKNIKVFVPQFKKGINVRVRDLFNDGRAEILVGAGVGGGPQVQVFSDAGKRLLNFFAFDKNDKTGVQVDAADIDNDGEKELIVAPYSIGGDKIKVFSNSGVLEQTISLEKFFGGKINLVVK